MLGKSDGNCDLIKCHVAPINHRPERSKMGLANNSPTSEWLFQSDSRPSPILGDKLDARVFEGPTDCDQRVSQRRPGPPFKIGQRSFSNSRSFRQLDTR